MGFDVDLGEVGVWMCVGELVEGGVVVVVCVVLFGV